MALQRAERKQVPLKIGVSGPSGSGKTFSALLMARGMCSKWEEIAVIDTENKSASLYAHLGPYFVNEIAAPFAPAKYIAAIKECEAAGVKVIIIDSITHEWEGQGGCLDMQNAAGGRYQDWAKVTPLHQAFLNAILQSPCHIITSVRRKQDYDMSKDSNGKLTVTKVGMKEVTREGFEYELTLSLEIDIAHQAKSSKDRTGLFVSSAPFIITQDTGKALVDWSNSGKAAIAIAPPIEAASVVPVAKVALAAAVEMNAAQNPLSKDAVYAVLKVKAGTPEGLKKVKTALKNVADADRFDEVPENMYPQLLKELNAA